MLIIASMSAWQKIFCRKILKYIRCVQSTRMQAKLGDTICPKTKAENGKVVVSLDDENEKPYAILEFAEKQENL